VSYLKNATATARVPQSEPLDETQVVNSAGGYVYQLDCWKALDRFLILGTEGGTYYASERKLTGESLKNVEACLRKDAARTIEQIASLSEAGRAPKNDPALYALAMAASSKDSEVRRLALAALPRVARIGTHLFTFVEFLKGKRGWSRGLRRGIAGYYAAKSDKQLVYDLVKYQSRGGWSHRDVLRLAHPTAKGVRNDAFRWVVKGTEGKELPDEGTVTEPLDRLWAFEKAKIEKDPKEIARLVRTYDLPRECVPTEALNDVGVWTALLERMPMTAMIRNLGKMTEIGLVGPLSEGTKHVVSTLSNREALRKSRVHPIQILGALLTYGQGHGVKGKLSWTPVKQVTDALDDAFYAAFDNVEPTGKRYYLGLDVSGSMGWGTIAGMPGLTPAMGAAAMALLIARTEKQYAIFGFAGEMREIPISPKDSLSAAMDRTRGLTFGSTDCALPMLHATLQKIPADVFVVITDNETWAGKVHPSVALNHFRKATGIPAKEIVIGMTATQFTVADQNDPLCIDVVGFDSNVPTVIADFAKNW